MQEITDEELQSIIRAISLRYGIDFGNYEPISFKRRVARVIDRYKLDNTIGLWRKFMNEKDFIYIFIDEITIGLTEMFRNADFWIKLRESYLPLFALKPEINIWHAGCSTGEEVYSMGILLTEEHLIQKSNILATDLNSQSIANTKAGTFSNYYENAYLKSYKEAKGKKTLETYYSKDENNMIFNKVKFNKINFQQHNLVKDPMSRKFEMIFCRNVMIYFDEILKMKVLELFYHSLAEDGLFMIGYYDAMPNEYRNFFELFDPQTKTYRKIKQ